MPSFKSGKRRSNGIPRSPRAIRCPRATPGSHSFDARHVRACPACAVSSATDVVQEAGQQPAAAHGLQRWRQGYDLREVTRELGKLNECVVAELDSYTAAHAELSHAGARRPAGLGGHVQHRHRRECRPVLRAPEAGSRGPREGPGKRRLVEIRELEQQRGDLWRQAAHRSARHLGVVANANRGAHPQRMRDSSRDDFVRILMRNVTSLHHLLEYVTSLVGLQADASRRLNCST